MIKTQQFRSIQINIIKNVSLSKVKSYVILNPANSANLTFIVRNNYSHNYGINKNNILKEHVREIATISSVDFGKFCSK